MPAVSYHAIENSEQFSHAGGQRQFLRFACFNQALVKLADHRVDRVADKVAMYSTRRS